MKLEQQVVSLDIAKRLKELGVPQDSLFWWYKRSYITDSKERGEQWFVYYNRNEDDKVNEHVSAFTCSELGELMPNPLGDITDPWWFGSEHVGGYWEAGFSNSKTFRKDIPCMEAKTEVDARGKLLTYLLEQGLVTLGDKSGRV